MRITGFLFLLILVYCGPTIKTVSATEVIGQINQILQCKGLPPIGTLTQQELNSFSASCSDKDLRTLDERYTCVIGSVCDKNGKTCEAVIVSDACKAELNKYSISTGTGSITPNNLNTD